MTQANKTFWAARKREEAAYLLRLFEKLNDITPKVQMCMYDPSTSILLDTAIALQQEANQLEG